MCAQTQHKMNIFPQWYELLEKPFFLTLTEKNQNSINNNLQLTCLKFFKT